MKWEDFSIKNLDITSYSDGDIELELDSDCVFLDLKEVSELIDILVKHHNKYTDS